MDAERHEWDAPGSEFLPWRAGTRDWLGAALCSFWWDLGSSRSCSSAEPGELSRRDSMP
jgi:hypothetical protein